MPGRDGTGPMGNGLSGNRGVSGNGRGRMGCRNGSGKNNRFANNQLANPNCWRWANDKQNDRAVLKNQAEYYQKQLELVNQRISNLDLESQV